MFANFVHNGKEKDSFVSIGADKDFIINISTIHYSHYCGLAEGKKKTHCPRVLPIKHQMETGRCSYLKYQKLAILQEKKRPHFCSTFLFYCPQLALASTNIEISRGDKKKINKIILHNNLNQPCPKNNIKRRDRCELLGINKLNNQ